jgi:hypothetical protein
MRSKSPRRRDGPLLRSIVERYCEPAQQIAICCLAGKLNRWHQASATLEQASGDTREARASGHFPSLISTLPLESVVARAMPAVLNCIETRPS